jgi:GAF domain-containing protein
MNQYTPSEEETIEAFSRELGIALRQIREVEDLSKKALLPKSIQSFSKNGTRTGQAASKKQAIAVS